MKKLFIVLSAFATAQAALPPAQIARLYEREFACDPKFLKDHPGFDPLMGAIAWETGLINGLYKNLDENEPASKLVKILFHMPHGGGVLVLSKYDNDLVAKVLARGAFQNLVDAKINTETLANVDPENNAKGLSKNERRALRQPDGLVALIANSRTQEVAPDTIVPDYTTDLILAATWYCWITQEHLEYDTCTRIRSDINRDHVEALTTTQQWILDRFKASENILTKDSRGLLALDFMAKFTRPLPPQLTWQERTITTANGNRAKFVDCVEGTVRNFFNVLCIDPQNPTRYNTARIPSDEPMGDGRRRLEAFYAKYPTVVTTTDDQTCNDWAAVVANIPGVEYANRTDHCEAQGTTKNVFTVIAYLAGINISFADTEPDNGNLAPSIETLIDKMCTPDQRLMIERMPNSEGCQQHRVTLEPLRFATINTSAGHAEANLSMIDLYNLTIDKRELSTPLYTLTSVLISGFSGGTRQTDTPEQVLRARHLLLCGGKLPLLNSFAKEAQTALDTCTTPTQLEFIQTLVKRNLYVHTRRCEPGLAQFNPAMARGLGNKVRIMFYAAISASNSAATCAWAYNEALAFIEQEPALFWTYALFGGRIPEGQPGPRIRWTPDNQEAKAGFKAFSTSEIDKSVWPALCDALSNTPESWGIPDYPLLPHAFFAYAAQNPAFRQRLELWIPAWLGKINIRENNTALWELKVGLWQTIGGKSLEASTWASKKLAEITLYSRWRNLDNTLPDGLGTVHLDTDYVHDFCANDGQALAHLSAFSRNMLEENTFGWWRALRNSSFYLLYRSLVGDKAKFEEKLAANRRGWATSLGILWAHRFRLSFNDPVLTGPEGKDFCRPILPTFIKQLKNGNWQPNLAPEDWQKLIKRFCDEHPRQVESNLHWALFAHTKGDTAKWALEQELNLLHIEMDAPENVCQKIVTFMCNLLKCTRAEEASVARALTEIATLISQLPRPEQGQYQRLICLLTEIAFPAVNNVKPELSLWAQEQLKKFPPEVTEPLVRQWPGLGARLAVSKKDAPLEFGTFFEVLRLQSDIGHRIETLQKIAAGGRA